MNDLVVNDIEEEVIALLETRAEEHGRSVEEEVLDIIRTALKDEE